MTTLETDDYRVDCSTPGVARVTGVLRLSSPAAYEERFEALRRALQEAPGAYTVDISGVRFLNSSGITWLSRLVLLARAADKAIVLVGSESVAWQGKTLTLLKRLYAKVDVRLC